MSDMRWLTDYNSWPARTRTRAPLAALIVLVLFWLIFGWGFLLSLVLALLVLAAVVWFTREETNAAIGRPPVAPNAPPPAAAPRPSPDPAPTPAATAPVPPATPPATAPVPPATPPADPAAPPVASQEPPAAEPPVPPADTASERVRAAARAAGDAARAMDAPPEASRPAPLDAPRGGVPDDLKRINGIGPKIETLVNSLGIYHFDQIASWTEREVAWVDSHLEGFHGRATRDGWVEQARILAAGGTIDTSQRGDRGEVQDD